ncbi:hypothetical protein [Glycomyces sp. NPDC047010]|uniref:hypothetical protein n=1 Tax=Glycomyces sp. NPDC047010 TaxID=3155023 RepID=UPI0033F35015
MAQQTTRTPLRRTAAALARTAAAAVSAGALAVAAFAAPAQASTDWTLSDSVRITGEDGFTPPYASVRITGDDGFTPPYASVRITGDGGYGYRLNGTDNTIYLVPVDADNRDFSVRITDADNRDF